eukprot:2794828-Amphidinium_carterae.1
MSTAVNAGRDWANVLLRQNKLLTDQLFSSEGEVLLKQSEHETLTLLTRSLQSLGRGSGVHMLQELNDLPPNDKQGPRPEFRFQTGATYLGALL